MSKSDDGKGNVDALAERVADLERFQERMLAYIPLDELTGSAGYRNTEDQIERQCKETIKPRLDEIFQEVKRYADQCTSDKLNELDKKLAGQLMLAKAKTDLVNDGLSKFTEEVN